MEAAPFGDSKSLHGTVRPATARELAIVYDALDAGGIVLDTVAPAVLFAGPRHAGGDAVAAAAERLAHFGVRVVALTAAGGGAVLEPATFLLGGTLHGWCVEDVVDAALHVDAMVALLERERLSLWGRLLQPAPAPVFTRTHRPGSDSTGVVQFRTDREVVAKIGPRDVIETEAEFLAGGNSWLRSVDRPPLFPDLYAVLVEGDQAVELMEAAEPAELADLLFHDERRTELRDDAAETLAPYLDGLAAWYSLTVEDRQPTVGDYLYRERFVLLPGYPAFTSTFRSLLPGVDLDGLLARDVRLPGGRVLPGYTAAVQWLDRTSPSFVPRVGTAVHGDIGISNVLRRADGSPVFIDPRIVWEGRDRPDTGFGDPVFDLATLLHAVLPMAAVLGAVARGAPGELFAGAVDPHGDPVDPHGDAGDAGDGAGLLDLSGLALPTQPSPALLALERRLVALPPTGEPEAVVRTRLLIGAATSLAGWLKYERSLRTREAWLATYAYVVWYLWRARTTWDRRPDVETDR